MTKKGKAALAGIAFAAGCEIGVAISLYNAIKKYAITKEAAQAKIDPPEELLPEDNSPDELLPEDDLPEDLETVDPQPESPHKESPDQEKTTEEDQ